MAYRVELTDRSARDLRRIYQTINAEDNAQARAWFNGLQKAVLSLAEHPARGVSTAEHSGLRHVFYGRRRYVYRIIYKINQADLTVTVLHIRYGGRTAFAPNSRT